MSAVSQMVQREVRWHKPAATSERHHGVRRADSGDACGIAQVQVASWQATYRRILQRNFLLSLNVNEKTDCWATMIRTHLARVWVVEHAGIYCGFAAAGDCRDADSYSPLVAELFGVYVHPAMLGLGFGTSLLKTALKELEDAGYAECVVWLMAENFSARRFYERAGFMKEGSPVSINFGGAPVEKIRYRKILTRTLAIDPAGEKMRVS